MAGGLAKQVPAWRFPPGGPRLNPGAPPSDQRSEASRRTTIHEATPMTSKGYAMILGAAAAAGR